MVFAGPFAHVPSRFADHCHRGQNIDPIDLSQVGPGGAKQLLAHFCVALQPLEFGPHVGSMLISQS